MIRLFSLIRIFRVHNIAAALLAVAAGYSMNEHQGFPWLLFLTVALATGAGNVINDYYDYAIDRINKPDRPIPSGVISRRGAILLYTALIVMAAATAPFLGAVRMIWIFTWVVLLHLYSKWFKRRFLIGNLTVSILTGTGFLLGSYSSGKMSSGVIPAAFTLVFILGREIVKDCEDIEGDFFLGSTTMAVVIGKNAAMKTASVIFLLLIIAFPAPYLAGIYSARYFLIIIVLIIPILLLSFFLALSGRRPGLISILLKVGIFAGILAFFQAV